MQVAVVLGVAVVVGALILQRDLYMGKQAKTSSELVTNISDAPKDVIEVDEPQFYLELPSDWKFVRHNNSGVVNYYEWQSTKTGESDRRLFLHVNKMPPSYKIVKIVPLEVNGEGFTPGNVSPNCITFAKEKGREDGTNNAEVEAKWEQVRFICDPVSANQTIGTGTEADGVAAKIGNQRFFFYFEDHNVRPNDQIFINIIKSFRAKDPS